MNSSIKIYKTKITPAKNALVDDLEVYLASLTPTYTAENFQYLKLGLDFPIKINYNQSALIDSIGNYVRIEQENEVFYYFIVGSPEWKAVDTVQLQLSIDSINTFRNKFTFSDKTNVTREHGKRFFKQDNSNYLIRLVDREVEPLENSTKTLTKAETLINDKLDCNWYLMYRTSETLTVENIANPIDCFLLADKPVKIKSQSPSVEFNINDFRNRTYYYFNYLDNSDGTFTTSNMGMFNAPDELTLNTDYYLVTGISSSGKNTISLGRILGIIFYRQDDKLYYTFQYNINVAYRLSGSETVYFGTVAPAASITTDTSGQHSVPTATLINNIPMREMTLTVFLTANLMRYSSTYYSIPEQAYLYATTKINIGANQENVFLNTIEDVDRTDSRLMKILVLPYCPVTITTDEQGVTTFPNEWYFDKGFMQLKHEFLGDDFLNSGFDKLDLSNQLMLNQVSIDPTTPKDIKFESKLYHSAFYTIKLVYDSFSRDIRLENLDTSVYDQTVNWSPINIYMPLSFKVTNTINSRFLFNFPDEIKSGSYTFADYKTYIDYENFMIVSRNNELSIFSNDYINYIRNGYNYDVKTKTRQNAMDWINWTIGVGGGLAQVGFGLGSAPQINPKYRKFVYTDDVDSIIAVPSLSALEGSTLSGAAFLVQGMNSLFSVVSGFVSNANNMEARERALQQKLAELSAQSTAVQGADDIDLLKYYNGNRLQVFTYEPTEIQKAALWKIFYYTGYQRLAMKEPDLNTRYWFNFIQCEPVFKEEDTTPYNGYVNDIKSRFATGVTVYHHHPGVGTEWDWDQQYENWEVDLLPTAKFTTAMLKDLAINDEDGFHVTYIGEETLDGVNTYIEFKYTYTDILYQENTKGMIVTQNETVIKGERGQYLFGGAKVEARIVDIANPSRTSDWLTVIL